MSIQSIGSNTYNLYEQLSTGKRINSAADDPAGLAIAEKLETQTNGYDIGRDNASASQSMINIADGALASVTDSLQRIRELSVQAANTAVYGEDEINAMQQEIDGLKEHISYVAGNTQFNTMNLLDGSMNNFHIATNPDGNGMDIDMPDSTLAALGITDYNVTGSFDISVIDEAINKVNSARSELGATSNRLDYAMNYNSYASYNLTSARSTIEDLDMPKAISELEKERLLDEYRIMMMKKEQEEKFHVLKLFK